MTTSAIKRSRLPRMWNSSKRVSLEMIEDNDAHIIDETFVELPKLLAREGMIFVQRVGYKAGKLKPKGSFSNWCQLVDECHIINVRFPNSSGQEKTWKLFARFDANMAPPKPWERPERYRRKKAQWMLGGDDVWGIAYEDIKELVKETSSQQLVQRLLADLKISFQYSEKRYIVF